MRIDSWSSLLLVAVPASLFLLNGCAGSAHEPAEKYILIVDNSKIAYWQTAVQGLHRAAAEMKVKSELQGSDNHDPQGEREAFGIDAEQHVAAADVLVVADQNGRRGQCPDARAILLSIQEEKQLSGSTDG